MICYASQTSTKRNLRAMRDAGWRLLLSAAGHLQNHGFKYALDNGAWASFQAGEDFNADRFQRALDKVGTAADWVVVPDIVAGGLQSLAFSMSWMERLKGFPLLLAVQDGMEHHHVAQLVGPKVGIFLGGSTEWKLATMESWGHFAAKVGAHYHVARVNSAKRIRMAAAAGAASIDGSSATRYAVTLPGLDLASRCGDLFDPRKAPA